VAIKKEILDELHGARSADNKGTASCGVSGCQDSRLGRSTPRMADETSHL